MSHRRHRPAPRRSVLLLGLALALAGLVVAGVRIAGARTGGPAAGAADFGPVPGGAASSPPAPVDVPATSPVSAPPDPADTGAGPPASLRLPRLGVRAPVEPVGVRGDGQVQVPADPGRVGWYRWSPPPGSPEGSAVLVGHVDAAGRGLGVLVALAGVRRGDRVLVDRADGGVAAYRVTARRTVGKRELAATDAFRRDGPPVLTLITCTGPYLPERGGYQNNLVVTAAAVAG
ncbi:class F sortase [Streptomyces sp. NPDC003717]|uniref:class F sortase n=1 Tax=Streptomyces sp. NPDC003717 TaxID=3154276 RepID=UPI0033BB8122